MAPRLSGGAKKTPTYEKFLTNVKEEYCNVVSMSFEDKEHTPDVGCVCNSVFRVIGERV